MDDESRNLDSVQFEVRGASVEGYQEEGETPAQGE
jgi:hypothetical protein